MFFLRKYYSPNEFAGAKASDFEVVGTMSPLEAFAGEKPAPKPDPQKQPEAEKPAEIPQEKPVEKQTEKPVDPIKPPVEVKPAQTTEQKPVVTEPVSTIPVPLPKPTLDQFLKEQGYDEFAINALKYYKETGDLTPYVKVKSIDYKSMAPEELMRHDLQEKYAGISDEAFQIIYREEVIDKYKLDPDRYSEAEIEAGKARLNRDAKAVRNAFLEYQSKFSPPERNPEAEEAARIAQENADREQFTQFVTSNPASQKLLNDKRLVFQIGDDGEAYTFVPDNPADVLAPVMDSAKWQQFTHTVLPDGSVVPNVENLIRIAAFAQNHKKILKGAYDQGFAAGNKQPIMEATNPDRGVESVPGEVGSLAEAFRSGIGVVKKNWG